MKRTDLVKGEVYAVSTWRKHDLGSDHLSKAVYLGPADKPQSWRSKAVALRFRHAEGTQATFTVADGGAVAGTWKAHEAEVERQREAANARAERNRQLLTESQQQVDRVQEKLALLGVTSARAERSYAADEDWRKAAVRFERSWNGPTYKLYGFDVDELEAVLDAALEHQAA